MIVVKMISYEEELLLPAGKHLHKVAKRSYEAKDMENCPVV